MTLVKCSGRFIQGMNEQGAYSADASRLNRPQHSVSQQISTKMLALPFPINSETGQDHDRDRIGHVSSYFSRGFCGGSAAARQSVESDHPPVFGYHISSACARFLVLQRAISQPAIK